MAEMTQQQIEEKIERLEKNGCIDPECDFCQKTFYPKLRTTGERAFAPSHTAMSHCRSGKRPHCTCDGCF